MASWVVDCGRRARRLASESTTRCPPREQQNGRKFELYEDKAGKHGFRLKAANMIIPTSEAYESKSGDLNGIDS